MQINSVKVKALMMDQNKHLYNLVKHLAHLKGMESSSWLSWCFYRKLDRAVILRIDLESGSVEFYFLVLTGDGD